MNGVDKKKNVSNIVFKLSMDTILMVHINSNMTMFGLIVDALVKPVRIAPVKGG